MRHEISEQDWNDYFEGELAAEARERIDAHVASCFACWEFCQRMARTTRALRGAVGEVRETLQLDSEELQRSLRSFLARVEAARADEASLASKQIQARLDALADVMAPMCGAHTARSALHLAARNSVAKSLDGVTHGNWESFLENLTSIAAVMCGATGADLVWESGRL